MLLRIAPQAARVLIARVLASRESTATRTIKRARKVQPCGSLLGSFSEQTWVRRVIMPAAARRTVRPWRTAYFTESATELEAGSTNLGARRAQGCNPSHPTASHGTALGQNLARWRRFLGEGGRLNWVPLAPFTRRANG
jgi:hypothetical protein